LSAVPHLKVWEKSKVSVRYHYGTSRRIFDLVVEADPGWGVVVKRKKKGYSLGAHGYDPANPDMHAVFYAMGPAFKTGYLQPAFENVDIYPLLTYILKIKPVQTDGSLEPVRGMLAH
ncbi:MAG: alkaline phosphatase family protein, partial [Bacteroidales bacterium]|nr:alkaline phosphatase family protein [Bacteroidales bacterium]